jgi:hypothetical protein
MIDEISTIRDTNSIINTNWSFSKEETVKGEGYSTPNPLARKV